MSEWACNGLLQTPVGHPDIQLIDDALLMLDGIIKHVDTRTGEAKCAFVKHKLCYTNDDQVSAILAVVFKCRLKSQFLKRIF